MKIIKKLLLASLLLFSITISGLCINYNVRDTSTINDVPYPSFLYKVNIGTGISGDYDLNISTTSYGSPYGLKFSTSVYAPAYYGDGSNLTGVTQDHALLLNLQGGSVGGVTNSDNVPFIAPSNYDYNASSITVTAGNASIAGTGSSASSDWEYITPSSYTYNSSSITVTGGVAKLLGSSTVIDLEGYWKMDEALWNGTPGEVADSSINSNNGTGNNGATTTAGGIFGNLGIFDGIDDNVSIPHNSSISFEITDSFSFQCWMKTDDAGTYDALISKQQVSGAYGINVQKTSSGNIRFNLVGSAGSLAADSTNIIDDDAVHHVIVTYDGSEDVAGVHIYIDGNDETLSTIANALSGSIVTSIPLRFADREALNQTFEGLLDEVAVWSRELTFSEVTSLYNLGSGLEINFYSTDNPSIETDFGWIFSDSINSFVETVTKPANTEIKYQISHDDGVTYKYWAGAIWSVSDGTYAQASTASDINTNIETLASSGVLKVKAFLNTSDLASTPELDNINVASGIIYQIGSFDIEMNSDIQPSILSAYLTATETVITPSSTTIKYQFSINSGVSYNGSWLTELELESALIGLSTVGDGSDTIRFKFQLTTTDDSVTPEIDNLNITTDGGTGLSELFHLSSGTYNSLIDLNAQLDQLHTDGSPLFSEVSASTIAAVNFYGDGENVTNVDAETLDGFDSSYFTPIALFNNEFLSLTTTYLGIGGLNANQDVDIGVYSITSSSGIFTGLMQSADIAVIGEFALPLEDGLYGQIMKTVNGFRLEWMNDNVRVTSDYDVLIGSYIATGIDVVYVDGQMHAAIEEAEALAGEGGTIALKSGYTYVSKSSATIELNNITILMNGATWYGHSDLTSAVYYDRNILRVTGNGFNMSGGHMRGGGGVSGTYDITGIVLEGDESHLRNMTIKNLGRGSGYNNSAGVYVLNATGCSLVNILMDYASGAYGLLASGNKVFVSHVSVSNTRFGIAFNNSDSLCEAFIIDGAETAIRVLNADRHVFSDFIILNTEKDAFLIQPNGHRVINIDNGIIYNTGENAIDLFGANTYSINIDNVHIWNAGTVGGDIHNAIDITGITHDLNITNCTFQGTIDKYSIGFTIDATNVNIKNNMFNDIIGNVPGDINEFMFVGDFVTNLNIKSNQPADEIGDYTVNESSFTVIYVSTITVSERLMLNKIDHAYGGFEDAAETIIADSGVWHPITNAAHDLWNLDEGDNITVLVDTFTVVNAGDYSGMLSLSISGVSTKDFHVRVYNITQAQVDGRPIGISTTGAANEVNVVLPIYIEAVENDKFQFEIMSADGSDPVVQDALFIIKYLHE